jgi:hypothetical protein
MREFPVFDTSIQNQALLNEFKGNLFEYLVGNGLAKNYGLEGQFARDFNGGLRAQLKEYELWLRQNGPEILRQLPELAKATGLQLEKVLERGPLAIKVTGKLGQVTFKEMDLAYETPNGLTPISLKLCKERSYVNTKSAGIRSFISKYFEAFERAGMWQKDLNLLLDVSYQQLTDELYDRVEMAPDRQFKNWPLSHLPGQLPEELRPLLFAHYTRVVKKIYQAFTFFLESDRELFKSCLLPLMGFGLENMVQATCYHGSDGGQDYQLKSVSIRRHNEVKEKLDGLILRPLKDGISSFEFELEGLLFQIRVKPMNKFTSPALKINCSLREVTVKEKREL